MAKQPRWLGIVVPGKKLLAVQAEVPDSGPIVIQADETWTLETGSGGQPYAAMHQRVVDYVRQNGISRVIVKSSSVSRKSVKLANLETAELRGVAIAAAASICEVSLVNKAVASRSRGSRNVDDYLVDDDFFSERFEGDVLRKGSREAAFLLHFAREKR